jgi:predicted MFS family arabinose efflux permease
MFSGLSKSVRQYMLVIFNYWNFTLTDGALRMLVVLYFHDLGYSTLAIASLFLFYEFFGVVTNLIGGLLLSLVGFKSAVLLMAAVLFCVVIGSLIALESNMGKAKNKPKFSQIFSKSESINILSAARMFLFGARDVWFVVALPIYLGSVFGWDHLWVGGFLASWVIAYGFVQGFAPKITGKAQGRVPDGSAALYWALLLAVITGVIAYSVQMEWHPQWVIVIGLMIFGAVFGVNSSLHSYLIVSYAKCDGVSLDVGFYYMANAVGRLIGTVLSGWVFQVAGLAACLWVSFGFLVLTAIVSIKLPKHKPVTA